MKLTYLLTAATCGFLPSVHGSVQDWQIQNLSDVTSYTTEGISEVSFTFYDPNTSLTTTCNYENAPGSGRPATVESYADCDDVNVKFTFIETSAKTGQIGIEYYITNEGYVAMPSEIIVTNSKQWQRTRC
jgi:hypothetical protein